MEFLRLELNIAADTDLSKWFELRMSDIMSQQSMTVRVSVVLRRTVCGKIDLRFTIRFHLSGSRHQSQIPNYFVINDSSVRD